MADLGSKSTDGRLSFVKYVTDNKRYAEVEYEIDKGADATVFTKKGTGLVALPKETKPKRKSNPKQMDGTKSDAPFVNTKKKSKILCTMFFFINYCLFQNLYLD